MGPTDQIPVNFDDITPNCNGKIKVSKNPTLYGFQDIINKSSEVQKPISHARLPAKPPLPMLNSWLPIQKNVRAADEKMPDLRKPYFGDDEKKYEDFYTELEDINEDDLLEEK